MNIESIPLIKHLGIIRNNEGRLELPFHENIESYFQTQHAGTQFTLAETASVDFLQTTFPKLIENAIPTFRGSETKFKQMSKKSIVAFASMEDDVKMKFEEQLERKSRANISIDIKLIDTDEVVTFVGKFHWFVQLKK